MLVAYFDDSNTHDDAATVTLAGYIAPEMNWTAFEKETAELFKNEGIKIFHANKFEARKNEFKGWTPMRQLRFAAEWLDIAKRQVMCGYAVSLLKSDFDLARSDTGLAQEISAFGYSFQIALRRICARGSLWNVICDQGISIVIEDGNHKNRGVAANFQRMLKDNQPLIGRVKSLSFQEKGACHAVQLADFLAYYAGKDSERYRDSGEKRVRPYLDLAFSRVPTDVTYCSEFYRAPDW